MGRGLGDRQRAILARLEENPGEAIPLHELADDPDDVNEMAKARSAVRGLQRRGLVVAWRDSDPDRLVDTTTIVAEVTADWKMAYAAEPNVRAWSGLHVKLATTL